MYGLLRNEFEAIVELFDTVAEHKIYVCHVKDSSIPKSGDQVAVTDIKLTGSLKEIFSSKQDAAGLLELDPKDLNRRILNFIKTEDAGFVKCRAQHLDNQKIEISNKIDGELTTSWNKVFLNLNK